MEADKLGALVLAGVVSLTLGILGNLLTPVFKGFGVGLYRNLSELPSQLLAEAVAEAEMWIARPAYIAVQHGEAARVSTFALLLAGYVLASVDLNKRPISLADAFYVLMALINILVGFGHAYRAMWIATASRDPQTRLAKLLRREPRASRHFLHYLAWAREARGLPEHGLDAAPETVQAAGDPPT